MALETGVEGGTEEESKKAEEKNNKKLGTKIVEK